VKVSWTATYHKGHLLLISFLLLKELTCSLVNHWAHSLVVLQQRRVMRQLALLTLSQALQLLKIKRDRIAVVGVVRVYGGLRCSSQMLSWLSWVLVGRAICGCSVQMVVRNSIRSGPSVNHMQVVAPWVTDGFTICLMSTRDLLPLLGTSAS